MKAESVLFRNFERSYSRSLSCPCSPDDDRQRRYELNKYGVNEKGSWFLWLPVQAWVKLWRSWGEMDSTETKAQIEERSTFAVMRRISCIWNSTILTQRI